MILRRISEALRKQDWLTISVELAVVVVGIFLGLQVDEWNRNRVDAENEQAFLARLAVDVARMERFETSYIEAANQRLENLQTTIRALQTCRLPDDDRAAFESTLLTHQHMSQVATIDTTYNEMVIAGAVARMRDAGIKERLISTFSEMSLFQHQIDYYSSDISRASDIIWRKVAFERVFSESASDGTGQGLTVRYDLEVLCVDDLFKNAILEVEDSVVDRIGVGELVLRNVRALSSLLQARLAHATSE